MVDETKQMKQWLVALPWLLADVFVLLGSGVFEEVRAELDRALDFVLR